MACNNDFSKASLLIVSAIFINVLFTVRLYLTKIRSISDYFDEITHSHVRLQHSPTITAVV